MNESFYVLFMNTYTVNEIVISYNGIMKSTPEPRKGKMVFDFSV